MSIKAIYVTGGLSEDLKRVARSWRGPGIAYFSLEESGEPTLIIESSSYGSQVLSKVSGEGFGRVLERLGERFLPYGAKLQLGTEGVDYEEYRLVDL